MSTCTLCGNKTNSLVHEIEQTVLRMIQNANPDWVKEDGSCQKCVDHYASLDELVQVRE